MLSVGALFDRVNRKTFVVILNAIHYELSLLKSDDSLVKSLWAHFDKLLLVH